MCRDCKAQNLERKRAQSGVFDEPAARPIKKGGYESKSKKIWRDRYNAARAWLIRDIERYQEGRARGYEDSWFYNKLRRSDWVASKYRKARADAKAHGVII